MRLRSRSDAALRSLRARPKDDWVNAGAAAYEQALKASGVRHQASTYPGTLHGFHNDTTPRYDEAAAKLAWQRTVAFFNAQLRG